MFRLPILCAALTLSAAGMGVAAEQYAPSAISAVQLFALNRRAVGETARGAYRGVEQMQSDAGDTWTMETVRNGGDFSVTVRQADFTWAYGSYGGQNWNQDANGLVMKSTSLFQAIDPYSSALRQPANPSSGVTMLGVTPTLPKQFVVEVAPSSGLVQRRFYDARNYLLVRQEETNYDGHHQVWEYDDYRPVSGAMMPHLVRYLQDGTTLTRQTRLLSFERLSSPPNLAIPASRALFALGDAPSVQIPADFDGAIFVPVTVNGQRMDFLLDSGSSDIVIDPAAAKELGMTSSGALRFSLGGDFTIANTQATSLRVGPPSAANVAMSTIGFDERMPGRRVRGLLGTDFIGSGALEVNFQKNMLTLYKSAPAGLEAQGWFSLPLRLDSGVPMVKANFSGLDGQFVVDLGSFSTFLYPHYFMRYPNHVPPGTPDAGEALMIGGRPFGFKSITMRSMILGDWVFGSVRVLVPSAQYAQTRDFDGVIGRDTLASFDIIFDYANSRVWLRPLDFK
jgi:hypothetical protein